MPWSARFKQPIPLPDGGQLETLADARAYLLGLSEDEMKTYTWQVALANLLRAARGDGIGIDFARISLALALTNPEVVIGKPAPPRPTRSRTKRVAKARRSPLRRAAHRRST